MNARTLFLAAALAAPTGIFSQERPPAPDFTGELLLVRYDLPRGFSDGYAPTRQLAKRKDGQDAVDWPAITLNGKPVFSQAATEKVPLRLRRDGEGKSPFYRQTDEMLQPGGHWFRPIAWPANRKHLYTADPTARCSSTGVDEVGTYELWLFPLRIEGEGAPQVKNVVVKSGGAVIYQKEGPWRSLTLLLPANAENSPYELTVDGRGPVKCSVGLTPVKAGNPVERALPMDSYLPGSGPKIHIYAPGRPEEFPHPAEWKADVAAAAGYQFPAASKPDAVALRNHYSPVTIYGAALPMGMSGGFWKKGMNPDDYAAQVSAIGLDTIFEPTSALPAPQDPQSLENRAAALARQGVRMGLQYDQNWTRPALQHPNLALLAHTLPEWHLPLYRSLQLAAARFNRIPGFAGLMIGGDNAGYMALAPELAPNPDRPWGEAMQVLGGYTPGIPRPPSLGSAQFSFEQPVPTQAEFTRFVERYDTAFRQYGYFAEAVREVSPGMTFTTATFGSSPGAGARGGWPWATLPGRIIFEGLKVQQAFDAGTAHSSKPMHLAALIDRLKSYQPKTPAWALVDNYKLFFGREGMQRAYAIALTRGIRGIGTNFLPTNGSENSQPEMQAAEKELNDWIRKYGATYAASEPEATIGVFYGALQAAQRPVDRRENAPLDELVRGCHEGKVTEALWLCHAAGQTARVVTHQEILRGPLPSSMKVLLLCGLNDFDASWTWSKGLEGMLQQFLDRGGRILLDDESTCPVPATKTNLRIASYVTQSEVDPTPLLFERNKENLQALTAALAGLPTPLLTTGDAQVWPIVTRVKDTLFVTAVNWHYAEGDEAKELARPADPRSRKVEVWKTKGNASLYVKPVTADLTWTTDRPIYDVKQARRLDGAAVQKADFSRDAFQWYALPPAEVTSVSVTTPDAGRAVVEVRGPDGKAMRGIPVELQVFRDEVPLATISGTSGDPTVIPPSVVGRGANRIAATELLTNLASASSPLPAPLPTSPTPRDEALKKFATRKQVPLTIALTAAQDKDPAVQDFVRELTARFEKLGRKVRKGAAAPGGVIQSLQPLRSPHRYPQWKTVPNDLVLIGTPQENVLIFDQIRGEIFPRNFALPPSGQTTAVITKSPFVGECDVLNLVTADRGSLKAWLASWQ